jgi:uncharacterized OsmC-like protein
MTRNGIDATETLAYIGLLGEQPEAGAVTIRTRHRWDTAYAVDWHAEELTVAGERLARDHALTIDVPEDMGGTDAGPVPGEALLAALGACVSQQLVELATLRGIDIDGLEVTCEAEVDLRGSYGLAGRPGLTGATIDARVRSAVDDDVLAELLQEAVRTSPAADSLANPVPLRASLGSQEPARARRTPVGG